MKDLKQKFDAANASLMQKVRDSEKKRATKQWSVSMLVGLAIMIVGVILSSLVNTTKIGSDNLVNLTLAIGVLAGLLTFFCFQCTHSKNWKELNARAKEFERQEIPLALMQCIGKEFELSDDFEENIVSAINKQDRWIDKHFRLVVTQEINDESVTMYKDGVECALTCWEARHNSFAIAGKTLPKKFEKEIIDEENINE